MIERRFTGARRCYRSSVAVQRKITWHEGHSIRNIVHWDEWCRGTGPACRSGMNEDNSVGLKVCRRL